jgi:uncharacterized membrane protein
MNSSRLEAFSDGVIAIIITIMVLFCWLWLVPNRRIESVLVLK